MIHSKTIARIAAVQCLYQHMINNENQDINIIAQKMLELYKNGEIYKDYNNDSSKKNKIKINNNYFLSLIEGLKNNLGYAKEVISGNLDQDKKIEDISNLLLSVLIVAISEMKSAHDTPPRVIINEYTDITSEMLNDSDVGFVNYILDKISKTLT